MSSSVKKEDIFELQQVLQKFNKKEQSFSTDSNEVTKNSTAAIELIFENVCNRTQKEAINVTLDKQIAQAHSSLPISESQLRDIQSLIEKTCEITSVFAKQEAEIITLREELTGVREENNRLTQVIENFDASMNRLDERHRNESTRTEQLHSSEVEILQKQITQLQIEASEKQSRIDSFIVSQIKSEETMQTLSRQNASLQRSLDILNVDIVKLKSIHQGEVSEFTLERSLKGFLTSKNSKHRILSFLPMSDILSLRLLNREYNLIVTRDFQLQRMLIGQISDSYNRRTQALLWRANHFQRVAESIPDEVLRVSILKFLCSKQQIADFVLPAIKGVSSILDGRIFEFTNADVSSANGNNLNSSVSSATAVAADPSHVSVDLLNDYLQVDQTTASNQLSVPTTTANSGNNSTNTSAIASKASKTFGFMKKLFDKKETVPASNQKLAQNNVQQSVSTQIANQQIERIDEEQANQLLSDFNAKVRVDRFSVHQFKEEKDILGKLLDSETEEVRRQLEIVKAKSLAEGKIGEFMYAIERAMVGLFVNTKRVCAESKAMYDLQQYLSFELIESKKQVNSLMNSLEDTRAAKISSEQMKDYLSLKLKETEKTNMNMDTLFLKNTKLIKELNAHNAVLQDKITALDKVKAKSDSHLKILAKELRNQLKKNNLVTAKYEKLLTNMNFLKEEVANFKIIEDDHQSVSISE